MDKPLSRLELEVIEELFEAQHIRDVTNLKARRTELKKQLANERNGYWTSRLDELKGAIK